jgi:hypothetical protein
MLSAVQRGGMEVLLPDCPSAGRMMKAQGILRKLKPRSLLDLWSFAMFLVAVIQLFLIRGLDWRVLWVFVVPPLIAIGHRTFSERTSNRVLATVFLTLLGFGVALGPVRTLFPDLSGVDPELPTKTNRILTWYAIVYILYVCSVLPLVLFIRALIDHRRKLKAEFSKFTCILGLIATVIAGPVLFAVCCDILGLLPVYRAAGATQQPEEPESTDSE